MSVRVITFGPWCLSALDFFFLITLYLIDKTCRLYSIPSLFFVDALSDGAWRRKEGLFWFYLFLFWSYISSDEVAILIFNLVFFFFFASWICVDHGAGAAAGFVAFFKINEGWVKSRKNMTEWPKHVSVKIINYEYDFRTPETKYLYLIPSFRQQFSLSWWVFTVWLSLNERQFPPPDCRRQGNRQRNAITSLENESKITGTTKEGFFYFNISSNII